MERTHKCGELTKEHIGQEVTLCGWVAGRRDLGGVIFLDIRDRWGLVQVTYYPESVAFASADEVRKEYVVSVRGKVQAREEQNINREMATGELEVVASGLEILNTSELTPFYITDDVQVDENLRLRYRYLDLRRPAMQRNLLVRARLAKTFRDFLDANEFVEVETPILTRSTPEGARDYLVPSRIHNGHFYALPQSPQLFKQLLMVSGMERYYQLARCFRDEDLRAERQPEFTQVDIEASFIDQDAFMTLVEQLLAKILKEFQEHDLPLPLARIPWQQAMEKYGSDKPDLRFAMEITDVSDLVADSEFKVFSGAVAKGGSVRALLAPGQFSRKEVDQLSTITAAHGAKGLAWMAVETEGIRSPIAKFFSAEQLTALTNRLQAKPGTTIFFVADTDTFGVVLPALGALRIHLGKEMQLIDEAAIRSCWVVNFPLFEYDSEEGRYTAAHHPFTAPEPGDEDKLATDPAAVRAQAYDLVLNGVEIAGGSIRNHNVQTQLKVLAAIGFSEQEAKERFGFLLEALSFGAPPHGGVAFGFDRLAALLAGENSIRNVIAFPKTNSAAELMTGAPAAIDERQLAELGLKTN
ncbi:MAG: aspartate--tRNA ligase [Firmicutes bacterium]|nr:aspartate--tRNA ligase [Bacillota bacterium]